MNNLEPRQIDAIERAKKKPELQPFLFRKIKGLKWFDELQKNGFFEPSSNPAPNETEDKGFYVIPLWPVLEYLEKTAPELKSEGDRNYVDKFLTIIRSVTKSSTDSGISNWRTWWYFVRILEHIPIDLITKEDIESCAYWLRDPFDRMIIGDELGNKFLPKLLAERTEHSCLLAKTLVEALTQLRWVEKPYGVNNELEPMLRIEEWHANKIFRNHSKKIGEVLEQSGLKIYKTRIEEILEKYEKDEYSAIWRPAIEDHEQNKDRHDAVSILITAFRDSLSGYAERKAYEVAEVSEYISELLNHKFKIFQRIAIHIIGAYFDVFKALAVRLIDLSYFTSQYRHEMFHLLKKNFSKFDESDKNKILRIIDAFTAEDDESEDIEIKRLAYKKLIWLSAIKDQNYEPANNLFAQNYRISGHEPEHPDFSSYMEVGWEGEISPYRIDELLSRDIDTLIDVLRSFRETGGWKVPTIRGLAKEFKQAIKDNPDYFKGHLSKFLTVDLAYVYEIIEAHEELWTEKKYDNWAELLDFCSNIIGVEGFWSEDKDRVRESFIANRSWIVGAIGKLLRAGTMSDDKAFEPSLLPKAENLLSNILEKQESAEFESGSDAVFVSINSARGKCIEALVNFALRKCRLANKEKGDHKEAWKEMELLFEKELTRAETDNLEFITLVANYLPNFLYLSRDWIFKNLDRIFLFENRKQWLCAMQGYGYVNTIYTDIYRHMKEKGHFLKALNADDLKSKTKKKILQNIVVAYLNDDETLENDNSLIKILIDRMEAEELNEVICFLWTLRNNDESRCSKVQSLWSEISKKIAGKEEENKSLLSSLCLWSVYILELKGNPLNLLRQAAPYAEIGHHSYIVIEELKKLVDSYPSEVADIFSNMLQKFAPTYKQEDIEYILYALFRNASLKVRIIANEIVDNYIRYGIDFPTRIRDNL